MIGFITLYSLIPTEFFPRANDEDTPNSLPSGWNAGEMLQFAWSGNGTLTWTPGSWISNETTIDLKDSGGTVKEHCVVIAPTIALNVVVLSHKYSTWYGFGHGLDTINIVGSSEGGISRAMLVAEWDSAKNCSTFRGSCDHYTWTGILVSYDMEEYGSIGEAYDDGSLIFYLGLSYNDTFAKISAWSLLTAFFTFQAPSLLGLDNEWGTAFNLLVALPISVMLLYLTYRLILLAIPFVGG